MPAGFVDWSGIRAAAVALQSVRDAAMRAAANLDPAEQTRFVERVNKRAYRERWLDQSKALSKADKPHALPLSKPVQSGADLLTEQLANDDRDTRLDLARAARLRAGYHRQVAEADPERIDSQAMKADAQTAGIVHKWQEKGQVEGLVNINFIRLELPSEPTGPVIDV